MPSIASWIHPEPVNRDPTLADGLQARVADPLWLLARQIGFGELTATDGGSPISARVEAVTSRLTRLRAPGQPPDSDGNPPPGCRLPPAGAPLEVLIESEPEPAPRPLPDPNDTASSAPVQTAATAAPPPPTRPVAAAQAGLHYLRLLRAAGIANPGYLDALNTTYPLPAAPGTAATGPPPASGQEPILRLYAGNAPDGQALYSDLAGLRASPPTLPARHPAPPGGIPAISAVALAWLDWYEHTSSSPAGMDLAREPTWQPQRMEYAASIAAPGPGSETVLSAGEHTAGPLDWYDFDLVASSLIPAAPGASLGAVPADLADMPETLFALPAPATYAGAPNPRWWTFEDGAVNFGDISAPTEGAITAVVVEYTLRYGNDHYVIPVPLPIGSLCRVSRLIVTTVFGDEVLIPAIADLEPEGPFRLFEHSSQDLTASMPRDPLFVLFPTVPDTIASNPVEEVDYLRDELAETVWAIEQTALGARGLVTDRATSAGAAASPPAQPSATTTGASQATWMYLPRTAVEQNWFPFVLPDPGGDPTLMPRAVVPDLQDSAPPAPPVPWGAVLAAQPALPQEEVTRAGVQVTRAWRYARWIDGSQLAWVARYVQPGRGEGSSGLQFDLALPAPPGQQPPPT